MAKEQIEIKEVLQEKNSNERDKKYNQYVKQVTPTHNCLENIGKAF